MKYDALVSGYVSMDHIIKVDTPVQCGYTSLITNADNAKIYYGGCSVNVSAALCRLNLKALPILRVGPDYVSNGFKAFLEASGIPLDGITVLENETTSACYLIQDPQNNHITLYYPGAMDKKYAAPIPDMLFTGTRLGIMTVASRPDNEFFFQQCRKFGVPLAFGMKDDLDAFPPDFLLKVLLGSRYLFMNEKECGVLEKLLGYDVTQLITHGEALAVVTTLGECGSVCYTKNQSGRLEKHEINACPVERVVDTTGAGDAYMAGFLYGCLQGRGIRECCCLGAALSSFVLGEIGCCTGLPGLQALEARAKQLYERE